MAQSVTLATTGTAQMILNPVAKSTTFQLVVPSSGFVSVEVTLDDPTIVGGPTTSWSLLSSGAGMASSTVGGAGLIYTVLSPLGGARLNSTTNGAGGSFTLKALQSVSA